MRRGWISGKELVVVYNNNIYEDKIILGMSIIYRFHKNFIKL